MNPVNASALKQDYDDEKFKPKARKWKQFYMTVTTLVWARNNHDGYQVDLYFDKEKTMHEGRYIL